MNWKEERIRILITGFGTRTSYVSGENFQIRIRKERKRNFSAFYQN